MIVVGLIGVGDEVTVISVIVDAIVVVIWVTDIAYRVGIVVCLIDVDDGIAVIDVIVDLIIVIVWVTGVATIDINQAEFDRAIESSIRELDRVQTLAPLAALAVALLAFFGLLPRLGEHPVH